MRQLTVSAAARPRRVTFRGGPLALLDTGPDDAVPVLFVPGYTGSKEDFLPLVDPLASTGLRVIAMDQRGQFESPGPDQPGAYTVEALAADVGAVAAWTGQRVHAVGHSFGGLVVRAAAIAAPESFRSVVLLGSGPAGLPSPRRDRIETLAPVLAAEGLLGVYERLEKLAAGDQALRDSPPELREFLRRRFLAGSPVALQAMGRALASEPDRVARLRATGLPILVTHGVADDAWSPATQAEMARRLGARHVVVPDSVHSPAVENPAMTCDALARFWAGTA